MLKDRVKAKLEEESYRLTPQRSAVLDVLIANSDDHLSAEEIYNHTKELHSEIGLATVYRNLELLEKLGIVHRFDYGDGQSRYELRLGSEHEHYHHHLICKRAVYRGVSQRPARRDRTAHRPRKRVSGDRPLSALLRDLR